MNLLEYRRNIYSQNGEDGVIAELLSRLGMSDGSDRWCVEFGAWDGKHLSNTFNLVESAGWNAVYIEGDTEKFRDLQLTAREFDKVTPIHGMVDGPKGGGSALDDLLEPTGIPTEYDLLSVDIDSSDLDVWARHTDYRPSIVVIEINSSLVPGILQWHGAAAQGNSFSSTLKVAYEKGYTLVCHTGNLIFVKDEFADRVGLAKVDRMYPERLFLRDWVITDQRWSLRNQVRRAGRKLPEPMKGAAKKVLGK